MRPLSLIVVAGLFVGAVSGDEPAKTESPSQKLFRQHAADYRFTFEDERKVEASKEPILFWSQPVRGGDDGGVFLWTSAGRPVAIGTFFIWPLDNGGQGVTHELHSLTPEAFQAEWHGRAWRPPENAVRWSAVTDAEPPATENLRMLNSHEQLENRRKYC